MEAGTILGKNITEEILGRLYGNDPAAITEARRRYHDALDSFEGIYGHRDNIAVFSVPGRTEICGNHTDHNAGLVLAASVDLDIISVVSKNKDKIIRIKSEGFDQDIVDLRILEPAETERFRSVSLIKGVCSEIAKLGYDIGGFDAYTASNVLKGSGLSSSAAFEVMIASVINDLYCGNMISAVEIAMIAQFAENEYFGKPCGLMDQIACSVGGFVSIDFGTPGKPAVEKLEYDFDSSGFALIIVDTGVSHADLNADYASIPMEMKEAAGFFGKKTLREVSLDEIADHIAGMRSIGNDRAIVRAIHYENENMRVVKQVQALKNNDPNEFIRLVSESGSSSWRLCQNVYSCGNVKEQGISLALAVSENIIGSRGACRVHGGGFAGTIQAFVPKDLEERYMSAMKNIFGGKSCLKLHIRPVGSTRLI